MKGICEEDEVVVGSCCDSIQSSFSSSSNHGDEEFEQNSRHIGMSKTAALKFEKFLRKRSSIKLIKFKTIFFYPALKEVEKI